MKRLKVLSIVAFTLIATSTYGRSENMNIISVKNESTPREVATTDSIKQIDKSKKQNSNTVDNFESTKRQSAEVNVGVFREDELFRDNGFNLFFTSWRQIKPWFSFGVGLGLRHYPIKELTLVPIFVDLKTNLPTKNISPFLSCKVGYSLGGRFFMNPKIGISVKASSKSALILGVGYEMQQLGTSYYGRRTDKTIGANIGIQF